MRRARWLRGALLVAPLVSGCTFLALDAFDPPHCTTSAQCAVLNEQAGIAASALTQYQCARQDRVCRLLPLDRDGDGDPPREAGGTDCDDANARRVGNEALARALCGGATTDCCDGVDNNCNDVIDEGQWRASAPQAIGPALQGVTEVDVAPRANAAPAVTYTAGGHGTFGVPQGATLNALQLRYERQWLMFSMLQTTNDQCPQLGAMGQVSGLSSCTIDDAAVAEADAAAGRWFIAAVNRAGCAAGQLRLGHFDRGSGHVILSDAYSNIAVGVDVSASQACTGASRAPALLGASRPALDALPRDGARPPEAVVAWLARPFPGDACGADASVEAMGIWTAEQRDTTGTLRVAVRGTDDGRPRVLGVTQGGGRPTVVGVATSSGASEFLVAYGASGSGVALHAVPAFDGSTAALDISRPPLRLRSDSAGVVDQVALAVGASGASAVDVGVAWREGCGADGSVWFARARRENGQWAAIGASVQLARSAARGVSVAYAEAGFVRPGFARGDATATDATDGGWVVTWVDTSRDARRVLGRRVLELDGLPLSEDPLTLAEALQGDVSQSVRAGASTSSARLTDVVYGSRSGALSAGELLCRSPMP